MQQIDIGRIGEELIPVLTLVLGLILGHSSGSRLAAEQRFEDRHQRWKERRQDLLVQLQRQAHTLAEEAGTAMTFRNSGEPVDREAAWLLRWNEARKDLITSSDLLGDAELAARVKVFIQFQDEVASSKFAPNEIDGRLVSVTEQEQEALLSLEPVLSGVTSLAAQRYQELEGPEPTFAPPTWWKFWQ
jgi:hypothetical protein